MHTRNKKTSTKPSVIARRKSALQRLEKQLKDGTKVLTVGSFHINMEWSTKPLTEADITRINKEIDILKQRV